MAEARFDPKVPVHRLFEAQVERTPDAVAVQFGAQLVSYRELNARANRVAHALIARGAGPNVLVALCADRSPDLVVGMLAILKAGAAYVPLDPEYPSERLAQMVLDCGAPVQLTETRHAARLAVAGVEALCLDAPGDGFSDANPGVAVGPDDLVYMIFTSGSTGKPKGALVRHGGAVNLYDWYVHGFGLGTGSRVLLFTSPSFDLTQKNVFGPLLCGGRVCLLESQIYDAGLILAAIERYGIDVANCTPSAFVGLLGSAEAFPRLNTLRHVFLGGEPIVMRRLIDWLESPGCQATIVNSYGPTECSDVVSYYVVERPRDFVDAAVPIGGPVPGCELQVLDEALRPVAPGQEGELCIAGICVGAGYKDRPELTADRFQACAALAGAMIYRTGDRVRVLADGNIDFLGRIDDQVKVRGFRIELGEVEAALRQQAAVGEAVVLARPDARGDKRLVAYLVRASDAPRASVSQLRAALQRTLPDFMLPTAWVFLQALPLSPNGKVDKKALPNPDMRRPELATSFVAARTPLERFLAERWCELLDMDRVGIHDRFFELGGTSLRAIEFVSALAEQLGRPIRILSFFEAPTIASFIEALTQSHGEPLQQRFGAESLASGPSQAISPRRAHVSSDQPIAVVGMAGRFPGAEDIHALWRNLEQGRSGAVQVGAADLQVAGLDPGLLSDPDYVAGTFALEDADCFDADFFGFTPREAAQTDPQIRLMLETSYAALEHAGYDPTRYQGRVGVFAGAGRNSYLLNHLLTHPHLRQAAGDYHMLVTNERDFVATQVAYRLNLRGPAINVQSACSTSGVALHMACQSLRTGDCDTALVGGVKVICPNKVGYFYVEGGPLAPQAELRAFDATANGMVRGSGSAMLVLKRLDEALADGDTVYGLVLGSAVNNDGSAKVGFTAPSSQGQAEVIAEALEAAGLRADDISYVEAHGTGTHIGDPIEVAGLTRAFRRTTTASQFCALGSIKTNVGHLDAAAAAAGMIKVLLSMQAGQLPPSLHYTKPNPEIDFERSPFFVNAALRSWPRTEDRPRRAGVSSFGLGGTNVHVVLQEPAPLAVQSPGPSPGPELIVLSGRTRGAVERGSQRLADFVEAHPELELADVAHTLQVGRRALDVRRALVVHSRAELVQTLRAGESRKLSTRDGVGQAGGQLFMFPGGGAQYPGMALGLYRELPLFRAELDRCAELLQPIVGRDIRELLYRATDAEQAAQVLETPSLALPALFATEYALARTWIAFGMLPSAMIGHSMGEYTAACLSGVMTLPQALALVACRGRLFDTLQEGAMLSVPLSEAEVAPRLSDLDIAAVNQPNSCVASGPVAAIEALQDRLLAEGVEARRVHIRVAAHSRLVEPILAEFGAFVASMDLRPPQLPFVSNVTGKWITAAEATDPQYWVRHLRGTVRFSEGLSTLFGEVGAVPCLEVGPGTTLGSFARQHPGNTARQDVFASLRHPNEALDDRAFLLGTVGKVWLCGAQPNWAAVRGAEQRRRVGLPTYAFERTRHWLDPQPSDASQPSRSITIPPAPRRSEPPPAPGLPAYESRAPSQPPPRPSSGPPPQMVALPPMDSVPVVEPMESVAVDPGSRRDRILEALIGIVAELSGFDPADLDPDATFLELGFDSLFLAQANLSFKKKLGVSTTARQLLESTPTLNALASFLEGVLPPSAFAAPAARPAPVPSSPDAPAVSPAAAAAATAATAALQAEPGTLDAVMRQLAVLQQQISQLAAGTLAPAPRVAKPVSVAPPPPASADALPPPPDKTSPWQPVQAGTGDEPGLGVLQQAHIDALMRDVQRRTPQSKARTQASRAQLSDPRTVQGFKQSLKEIIYPIVSDRAKGSRIWDIDGNEYIDLVNGYGATYFGHAPEFILREVEAQLRKSIAIGPQTPLAGEVAALVCELTGLERVAFCNTGSEAVLAAIRTARTVTGKKRLATFAGHYHGIFDEVLVKGVNIRGRRKALPISPGIPPEAVQDVLVMDYGDPASFELLREHADQIALVMVEPVRSRDPAFRPAEFVRELRRVTEELDIPLMMDEMVTGFRAHPGGAQALWGVRADLATYGKVAGGGFPIGIVAGSARYMDALDGGFWRFGDESRPEADMTWFAGTFVRHPVALAACKAALGRLKQEGPALQERLAKRLERFAEDLNAHFKATGAPLYIEYFASWFMVKFETRPQYANLLFHHLHNRGVYTFEGRPAYLTTEHGDDEMQLVARAFKDSVAELQRAGLFPGQPIQREDEILEINLSSGQQEIWLATRFGNDASRAFNLANTLDLAGTLDVEVLQSCLDRLVARHEALRAVPNLDGSTQRILPPGQARIALQVVDLAELRGEAQAAALEAQRQGEVELLFDLDNGPLARARLLRLGPEQHQLILTCHHIVADGWSCGVLLRELGVLYSAARSGAEPELRPAMQLSEWVAKETLERDLAERRTALDYWLQEFAGGAPVLDLPVDRPRPPLKTYRARRVNHDLGPDATQRIKRLAGKNGVTPFVALLSTFQVLVHRLSGQTDLVVGFSLAGQSQIEGRELIGHCVNFLPLRFQVEPQASFGEHMVRARGKFFDASDHQNFTFGLLVQKLNPSRDPSRVPVMSVAFNLDPSYKGIDFGELTAMPGSIPRVCENFDLFFNVVDLGDRFQLQCTHNRDLFAAETVARWLGEYATLLEAACVDASTPVNVLPIATAEERALVATWNDTARPYSKDGTLHGLFEAQVQRTPEAVALISGAERMSYAELNRAANRVAHALRAAGVQPDDLVGLYTTRSPGLVVGLLGILKSGAAYVPIDPAYPAQRVAFLFEDSCARSVVTELALREQLPASLEHAICVDDPASLAEQPTRDPEPRTGGEHLAYVIYTSGSTGKPKGVAIEHHSACALVAWAQTEFSVEELKGVLFSTSVCFDLSVFEQFAPLATGGSVVLADNALALRQLPAVNEITLVNTVPSAMTELLRQGDLPPTVKAVNLAGEPLRPELVDRIYARSKVRQVRDLYGPSEDTTYSTCARRSTGGIETIGRPIHNTRAYLLDAWGQPVPLGATGELFLAGEGVARGYLHRRELTAERFLPDPWVPGERMYRTGDLVHQLPSGDLVFHGRADHQVKLRGFRIELGEVEQALRAAPLVQDAVVLADMEQQRLVAFYTGEATEPARMRALLSQSLPAHAVPQLFQHLDALPLTPNGKVDRKALPQLAAGVKGRTSGEPRSQVEEALLRIWREVLGLPGLGVFDNFFEAGGHSLHAMQVVDIAHKHGILIDVRQLFLHGTVAGLASAAVSPRVMGDDDGPASLVTLRGQGARPPLFLLHSLPGDLLHYGNLVNHLGRDQPVLGFHATAPLGRNGDLQLAELARHYVDMLMTFQPQGPYHLAGWCFGGAVASEMAVQLRERGQRVGLLGLIESWPHEPVVRRAMSKLALMVRSKDGPGYLQQRLLAGAVPRPDHEDPAELFALQMDGGPFANRRAVYEQNNRANEHHLTRRYHGQAVLFRAGEQPAGSLEHPDYGWQAYVRSLKVVEVPGPHRALMDGEHSKVIAARILREIDLASQR